MNEDTDFIVRIIMRNYKKLKFGVSSSPQLRKTKEKTPIQYIHSSLKLLKGKDE